MELCNGTAELHSGDTQTKELRSEAQLENLIFFNYVFFFLFCEEK